MAVSFHSRVQQSEHFLPLFLSVSLSLSLSLSGVYLMLFPPSFCFVLVHFIVILCYNILSFLANIFFCC